MLNICRLIEPGEPDVCKCAVFLTEQKSPFSINHPIHRKPALSSFIERNWQSCDWLHHCHSSTLLMVYECVCKEVECIRNCDQIIQLWWVGGRKEIGISSPQKKKTQIHNLSEMEKRKASPSYLPAMIPEEVNHRKTYFITSFLFVCVREISTVTKK